MSQKTEKPSTSDYDRLVKFVSWTPFVAGAVLLALVVAYVVAFYQNGWSKDPDAWGQLGDYIGGLLNSLVAGFALLALVISVRLQKVELTETGIALEAQATTAEQQRSEQRFFDLLNIYKITLDNQNYSSMVGFGDNSVWNNFVGKEAIYRIYSDADHLIESICNLFASKNQITIDNTLLFIDLQDEGDPRALFDRTNAYSRSVLMIVKTISEDASVSKKYLELFIGQLTQAELSMIAIYILLDSDGASYVDIANSSGLFLKMKEGVLLKVLNNYFLKDSSSREDVYAH